MDYSKEFLEKLYKMMLKIRFCEESFVDPILKKEIQCPVHLYSGEEAIAAGVCAALTEKDYVFGNHRSHGHYLAKGGDIKELIAEIYCKETGCSKGRGGSMHIIAPEKGFLGAAPIVAGTIPLAVGSALASKIRKQEAVSVSFFGDGATGEGVLYESLNFAALKKLPVIFICENNFYSTHLHIRECRPPAPIYKIAQPFGISSIQVDGNDVLKIFKIAEKAVRLCRQGKGPFFIEFLTYRLRGHVGPDDNIQGSRADIRPAKEVEEWKRKDPVKRFEKFILENKILEETKIQEIKKQIQDEVKQAHNFAKQSPNPLKEQVNKYVFK
ncbi:thiamine pyrophosphate-dependent dehydrogenase E1 component subunit alpha [Candidatus Parcubacteria bacterium]|nr:thiamine pyrophosphate-dependent dehydrogenase E1 component subunit alpha [Candidatus Parcubacteria bacterium]